MDEIDENHKAITQAIAEFCDCVTPRLVEIKEGIECIPTPSSDIYGVQVCIDNNCQSINGTLQNIQTAIENGFKLVAEAIKNKKEE